ncbi:uncharacterized protein N7482_010472 [Penicillium canariense]|uniref:Zn(2)-C6 fungal-type domain-containing protein n=1 Tax=Penicillium canariense TaxID=189055 RepID=A0A9W9LEJ4_9EURO|nr:uncharacterized protein N7482_010472 [Penicillium canariense]KAJ5151220.1 hypothetical protein N7482_010472 [Penicillium canariense]
MGGAPFQSKGCTTCKRRKIKCDRRVPECARCIKYGVKCEGYEGGRIFLYDASVKPRIARAKVAAQKSEPHSKFVNRTWASYLPQAVTTAPARRAQVFSSYIHVFFPSDTKTTASDVDGWYSLISGFASLPSKTKMLENALSAIACCYLGKLRRDDPVFRHGLQLYNAAIRDMSSMINKDDYCDDIIYTTVIFQEIETCYSPQGLKGWLAHIAGTNAILSHYRSRADSSPLVSAIYHEYQKLRIVFSAKGINMSRDDYDYVTQPSQGNRVVELLGLFAGLAPIAAAVEGAPPSDPAVRQMLLQQSLAHKDKLVKWYARQNISHGPTLCAPGEVVCTNLPQTDDLFGTAYSYPSLDNARLHTMFWTLLSITHPVISKARALTNPPRDESVQVEDSDILLSGFYADQIGRSVPYFMQDTMKSWGAHTMVFCLCQLCRIGVDRGSRPQFDWCLQAFDVVMDRGFGAATALIQIFHGMWYMKHGPLGLPPPAGKESEKQNARVTELPEAVPDVLRTHWHRRHRT